MEIGHFLAGARTLRCRDDGQYCVGWISRLQSTGNSALNGRNFALGQERRTGHRHARLADSLDPAMNATKLAIRNLTLFGRVIVPPGVTVCRYVKRNVDNCTLSSALDEAQRIVGGDANTCSTEHECRIF